MAVVEVKAVQKESAADHQLIDEIVRAINTLAAVVESEATGVTSDVTAIVYSHESSPRT